VSRTRNPRASSQAIASGGRGLTSAIEPRIRGLVADRLGVEPGELALEVSLIEDLAADSLDLVEVALAVESELGITLPDRVLNDVRTYGDLVVACAARFAERGAIVPIDPYVVPVAVHARIEGDRGVIERSDALTPYGTQTIADDVRHAGRNVRLDVTVSADASDATVAAIHDRFAALATHGVDVRVARDRTRRRAMHRPDASRDQPRPDAAV